METTLPEVYKRLPPKTIKETARDLGLEDCYVHKGKVASDKFIQSFLSQSVGAGKAEGLMEKLRFQTVLLDRPHKRPKPSSSTHPRPHRLTTREKRKLGLHEIPVEQQRYENFVPLHELWLGYMQELLQLPSSPPSTPSTSAKKDAYLQQLNQKVLKADYHGSILRVWRSKCPTYVGTEGILLQETQNTLRIIAKDNKIRTIPKANSVFTFEFQGYKFYLYGNHMKYRASERSAKKFKVKSTIDL